MNEKNMEIVIPTWNRAKYLDRTLSQFSKSSFLDYKFTIIDNNSTDNTQEICKKYQEIFPNFNVIRNNKNIGGLPNILRCYEIATAKYLWLVGDNDTYDFSNCNEVIDKVENSDFDLIFVQGHDQINLTTTSTEEIYENGYGNDLIMILGTISAYILKTELYTEECIQEGYMINHNWFPHFTFANKALKENFSVFISPKSIRIPDNNPNDSFNNLNLIKGWVGSNLIFEKKYMKEGIKTFRNGVSLFEYVIYGVVTGKINKNEDYRETITDLIIYIFRAKGIIKGLGYAIIIETLSIMPLKVTKWIYNIGHKITTKRKV